MQNIELLSPAGNIEKLKFALIYGADAVYCGGKEFSLRANAGNLTLDEITIGKQLAHKLGKKLYVTINVFPQERDLPILKRYIEELASIEPDAFIIADIGVWSICQKIAPNIARHVSTQANTINSAAVEFWRQQGAERIILARETRLSDVKKIADTCSAIDLEMFCHGAMCIAYSGRCLMSAYFNNRSANQGECTHPCRWQYHFRETTRKNDTLYVEEDDAGTYLFASKDLCLLPHINDIIDSGVKSLKIEGRMKSLHYVATVTKVYRSAIDAAINGTTFNFLMAEKELELIAQREYTTGFAFDDPSHTAQIYSGNSNLLPTWEFVGVILAYDVNMKKALVEQRNKISLGDELEVFQPQHASYRCRAESIWTEDMVAINSTPHPMMRYWLAMAEEPQQYSLLRVKKNVII